MADFKLQYPVSVCYHKRWFAVENTLCVLSLQSERCCASACIGCSRSFVKVICTTVVGTCEENGATLVFYYLQVSYATDLLLIRATEIKTKWRKPMFTINRTSLTGYIPEHPHIFFKNSKERVATLSLHTFLDEENQQHLCKYNIFIENPPIVEYVDTFLNAGDLIYVEGQLEPMPGKNANQPDRALENWIVISADQGMLLLVHAKNRTSQKALHHST